MSKLPPIDQAQRDECLNAQASFIVQAPAGSGKTTLLTARFIRLLTVANAPSDVVAITFTRKAAAEMRARIADELARATLGSDAALAVERHASTHGVDLRQSPERLRILTFDSFFLSLARLSPFETGISEQTSPLTDASTLHVAAARAALTNHDDSALVRRLLRHWNGDVEFAIRGIASLLQRRDQWLPLLLELRHANPAAQRDAIASAVAPALEQLRSALIKKIPAAQLDAWRVAATIAQQQLGTGTRMPEQLPKPNLDAMVQWRALLNLALTQKGDVRSRVNVTDGLPTAFRAEIDALKSLWALLTQEPTLVTHLATLKWLPAISGGDDTWQLLSDTTSILLRATQELMVEFEAQGGIDFVQPACAIAAAAANHDGSIAPQIAETVRHLLVDEFQDTSVTQFRFLEAVVGAWRRFGDGTETLFCVGDPMQSIYGFRQADVALFHRAQREGIASLRLKPITLSVNFRARAPLVTWVNEQVGRRFRNENPFAEKTVNFAAATAYENTAGDDTKSPSVHAFEHEIDELRYIVEQVKDWQNNALMQSIGILVQGKRHGLRVAQALRDAHVPIQGDSLIELDQLEWCTDVLTIGFALSDSEDAHSWLALLRAPWCGLALSDVTTVAAALNDAQTPWQVLIAISETAALTPDGNIRVRRLATALAPVMQAQGHRALVSRVDAAWARCSAMFAYNPAPTSAAFGAVLDAIREASPAGWIESRGALIDAIRRIPVLSAPHDESKKVISILTIHASKGLEFDAVLVPFCARKGQGDRAPLVHFAHLDTGAIAMVRPQTEFDAGSEVFEWLDARQRANALSERVRVLYVAATRAARALIFTASGVFNRERSLKPAPTGTIWSALQPEQIQTHFSESEENQSTSLPALTQLRRIAHRHAVAPVRSVEWSTPTNEATQDLTARVFGTVVHRWLSQSGAVRVARASIVNWACAEFHSAGFNRETGDELANAVADLMRQVHECPHAATIWSSTHRAEYNELTLGVVNVLDDRRQTAELRPDRVYWDANGVVWIVDFKTSEPRAGQSLTTFIHEELSTYHEAMRRYVKALERAALFPAETPIRAALYFPKLSEFSAYDASLALPTLSTP